MSTDTGRVAYVELMVDGRVWYPNYPGIQNIAPGFQIGMLASRLVRCTHCSTDDSAVGALRCVCQSRLDVEYDILRSGQRHSRSLKNCIDGNHEPAGTDV